MKDKPAARVASVSIPLGLMYLFGLYTPSTLLATIPALVILVVWSLAAASPSE